MKQGFKKKSHILCQKPFLFPKSEAIHSIQGIYRFYTTSFFHSVTQFPP